MTLDVRSLAYGPGVSVFPARSGFTPGWVIVTREKDNGLHMWEQQWMDTGKRAVTKAFFPISEEQATTKNSSIPRVNNNANRTWENKFILTQIWTNR